MWSNYNIKMKNDHWLCKGIRLHGQRSQEQLGYPGKMIETKLPGTTTHTLGEAMEILHPELPPMSEK